MSGSPRVLDWDTAFFGRRIASLDARYKPATDVDEAVRWCRAHQVACLYLLSDAADLDTLRAAEQRGFRLVDVRITLDARPPAPLAREARASGLVLRDGTPADAPHLRELAARSHRGTRFYADARFARERCDELYATWIERALGGASSRVLVPELDGRVAGYLTCELEPDGRGRIGLVAVADEARGRGVGAALVRAGLGWFAERGAAEVRVVTQGRNVAAQRLYQACGMRTSALELWHHLWLDAEATR